MNGSVPIELSETIRFNSDVAFFARDENNEFGEPLPEYILGEIDFLLGESSHFANTLLYAGEQLNNFANDPKFGERVPYYGELENKHDK